MNDFVTPERQHSTSTQLANTSVSLRLPVLSSSQCFLPPQAYFPITFQASILSLTTRRSRMLDFTVKVHLKFQRHKQSDNQDNNQMNLKDANPLSLSNIICKSMANINWSKNTKAPHSLISSIVNEYKNSVAPLKQSLG